jgi:hypothetical protein
MGREHAYHVSDTLTKHGSSNGQRLRTAVYHSKRISFLNVNPQLTMSSGIFNTMRGLIQSPKPVPRAPHVDHPLAQPSPAPPKTSPIPSAPPLVPPKGQKSHAGGNDPRIEHVRARRASEMGHVGNPAQSSGHSEGGRRDDRAEARLMGQERDQEAPKRQNSYAGGIDPRIGHVRTRRVSEMSHVGNPAKFSSHGEGGGWDDRAEVRLVLERDQEDRNVESRRKIEKLRLEVRMLKEDKEGLKKRVLALQTQALEADKKHKRSLEDAKALQDENEHLFSHIKSITSDMATKEQAAVRRITEIESRNQQQEEEIRTLRQRILQSDEKQDNTDRLLQARTADLKGVETFLTTADEYSGAEIMTMVESLNGEIFQISAFMAETLENESQVATAEEHGKNITRFRKALEFSRHHIGANLFSHLKDNAAKVRADALPLQLGLQALLTTWCTLLVRSWVSGPFDDDLQKLYKYIRNSGE